MLSDPIIILSVSILSVLIGGFFLTWFFLRRWSANSRPDAALIEWLKSMQVSFQGSSTDVARILQENTRQLNDRLDNATKVIASVQKNLGEMTDFGRGVKEIQELLQSPKLRGNLGEQILSDMLRQILPRSLYKLQYSFKSGDRVDAVIITSAGLLCIDSKFPMSNFRLVYTSDSEIDRRQAKKNFISDVKKHISAISDKYLNPQEGTVDVAFMYVPSESVFYEIASEPDLTDFASDKRVVPVSPATLYAYLKGVLMAYQSKQMQEKSFEIIKLIKGIQKDYLQVENGLSTLNRHLTNAFNQLSVVNGGFTTLGQKLHQTQALSDQEEPAKLLNK
jgi:DNA recombination protein RmuC